MTGRNGGEVLQLHLISCKGVEGSAIFVCLFVLKMKKHKNKISKTTAGETCCSFLKRRSDRPFVSLRQRSCPVKPPQTQEPKWEDEEGCSIAASSDSTLCGPRLCATEAHAQRLLYGTT